MKKPAHKAFFIPSFVAVFLLNAPISSNYMLQEWSIGGAGTDQSQSENYQINAIMDPLADDQLASDNFRLGPGLIFTHMANTPPAPYFANEADWYNKLQLTLDNADNPSHATFAVAISTDNFTTTQYVKSDNTVGDTLELSDWRDYTDWGGSSGILVVGLQSDTTYYVRVKAERGHFTESPWGPITSADTNPPNLSFDIDASSIDEKTDPPYEVNFGDLESGTVTDASEYIWFDIGTNAEAGAIIYISGDNSGLYSATTGHTISTLTGDLSTTTEGYGIRADTYTQDTGGPLETEAPFNTTGHIVGSVDNTIIPIFNSSLSPIIDGRGSMVLKAIINPTTPAAGDYTETITLIAAGVF